MMTQQAGGLSLPSTIGPGFEEQGQIEASWNTFEEMELTLTRMGFPPVEQPTHTRPVLTPEILTTPDSRQYTEIYWQVESWHNYAFNIMARIKAILVQVANEKNNIERAIRKDAASPDSEGMKKEKMSKQELDDLIAEHPRYQELTFEEQKMEQQKLILQSHVDSLERDLKLVSRQVEIRRQDIDAGRSATSLPTRGMYGRGRNRE